MGAPSTTNLPTDLTTNLTTDLTTNLPANLTNLARICAANSSTAARGRRRGRDEVSRQRGLASFGFTRELDEVGIGGGWRFARDGG